MPLTIRRATSEDSDVVVDFNRRLAEESESKKLDAALLKAGVAQAHLLRRRPEAESLV